MYSSHNIRAKRDPRQRYNKVTKAMHGNLIKLWNAAVREYLRAIALKDIIKIDTGMSKASLLPLARAVKMHTEMRGSISGGKKKKGAFDIHGNWDGNAERSIAEGEASSRRKAGYNLLYGSHKRPVLKFEFEITVWQYLLHEHGHKEHAAWNTIQVGRAAFLDFINDEWRYYLKDDLDIKKWLLGD